MTSGEHARKRQHKLCYRRGSIRASITSKSLQTWPQVRQRVAVQVLLRADPAFIKGFIVGFPSGSAVWTDWYALLQRTWGPLWIWLQLEAVGDCDTSGRMWGFLDWVKGMTDMVTKAQCATNRCHLLLYLSSDSSKQTHGGRTVVYTISCCLFNSIWSKLDKADGRPPRAWFYQRFHPLKVILLNVTYCLITNFQIKCIVLAVPPPPPHTTHTHADTVTQFKPLREKPNLNTQSC